MDETQKNINKYFNKLPKGIKDAILATDLKEKFKTITVKHKLQLDQAADIENETMFVMLGLEHPDDYTENIKREAELTNEEALKITEEVNRVIFLPIRGILRELHEEKSDVEEKQEEEERAQRIQDTRPATTGAAAPTPKDIFREKLGGSVTLPKEESVLHLSKSQTTSVTHPKDLYREPIDSKDLMGKAPERSYNDPTKVALECQIIQR